MASADSRELESERASLRAIQAAHSSHLLRARRIAETLAAEAAEATEDGIRDLYDEDAEVDAAVAAALVRQSADRAMHAFRRVAELESMGDALAFGYTVDEDGDRLNVGRLSVIDGDDALLVDWRADASIPFYRATPLDRLAVQHRRHLLYGDGVDTNANELHGYSDEIFDLENLGADRGLRGEAAILASVSAPTDEQMRSVVATIQAEQDAVVRATSRRPLVVQGGPGTGKTVVALHRAAYLLYDDRANLKDSGVLVVGPTNEFLHYIRGVLPSLGETGVVSVTAAKLFPGVLLGLTDDPEVNEIKGRAAMADLLAHAVADRQRRPKTDLQLWYGSVRVTVGCERLQRIFNQASGYRTHNDGARAFRSDVITALAAEVYDPSFGSVDDAVETFTRSPDVERFVLAHWPSLTPEQALNDLLGSHALLRSAAGDTSLTDFEVELLHRKRTPEIDLPTIRWSEADIPLLDELLFLLGGRGTYQVDIRDIERDAADEFELADQTDDEIDEEEALSESDEVSLDDPLFGERVYFETSRTPFKNSDPDGTDLGGTDPDGSGPVSAS